MFFNRKLECTACGREVTSGEKIIIQLTLPDERKMPVGVLDKVLSKYADKVYCSACKDKHEAN